MKDTKDEDKDLFGNRPLQTQCAFCDKVLPSKEAVVSTLHVGSTMTWQEHFCSTEHGEMFWKSHGWPSDDK